MTDFLKKIFVSPIFSNWTVEEVCLFLHDTDYIIKDYNIYDKVNVINGMVMFLIKGVIRRTFIDIDGNSTDTNTYHQEDEYIIVDGLYGEFYNMDYIALERCIILYLPLEALNKNSKSFLEIENKLYKSIFDSMVFANKKNDLVTVFNVQKSVKSKLELYIDYQLNPPSGMAPFSLTKLEVANMLKIDYSSLCREIRRMSEEIPNIESCFNATRKIHSINMRNKSHRYKRVDKK